MKRAVQVAALLSLLFSLAIPAVAAVTLKSQFGFDGQLIRFRYAPVRVEVAGLTAPVEGHIVVKQFVGSDPSNPVPVSHEIARGRLENGIYQAALPAYDLLLPLLVQLLGPDGEVLASTTESVRQAVRGLPFIVVAGDSRSLGGTESIVSASELPSDWWAYEPVQSLWLTEPLLDQAVWEALGEWVAAGGSLVLFSGSDFYQWDCPAARALLPLSAPTLREFAPGAFLLTGTPRTGAQVLLSKDAEPLLVRIQHGAGHVSLVTTRLRDVTDADLQRIAARIPAARRLVAVDHLTQEALNNTRVVRPLYAFAPVVVVAVILGFVAFHRRASRKSFAAPCALFLAAVAAVTVASGFYVNRVGSIAYNYCITTSFAVQTSFTAICDSYAFFSLGSTSVSIDHDKRHFPIQADVWVTTRSLYALDSALTQTTLALPARTRRFVRACGTEGANWRLLVTEDDRTFRIENPEARGAQAALLFLDGLFYEVPLVDGRPREAFAFVDLHHVNASLMTEQEFLLYTSCADWLATSAGTWLLTYEESSEVTSGEEIPEKVSLVRIEIAEGERT
ncbi:MAG: hypothetical protein NTY63_05465 [Candidatus Bipolaricaulota bacterium]|nr:hypothetical protein [Candidatus Bipolaricaulota bacterium]